MKRTLISLWLLLALSAGAPAEGASELRAGRDGLVQVAAANDGEQMLHRLELERGKVVLLQTQFGVGRVAVGDPAIVDFVLHGSQSVQLVAKAIGETSVLLWDRSGALQAHVDVAVGAVRAGIERELQRVLGSSDIHVDLAGDSIVLRGSAPSALASEQAQAVARAFFSSDGAAEGAEPKVINMLQVGGNQQVLIDVVIAEMSRTLRKRLGTNFRALDTSGSTAVEVFSFLDNLTSFDGASGLFNLSEAVTLAGTFSKSDFVLDLFLSALQQEGLGKILAEPSLVARSGELASFLAGGEIPIPVVQGSSQGLNNVTVIFKNFGVKVEFTPTVLSSERIHLQIAPEVSEPDFNFGTTIGGTTVPAFNTRRASTGVELADGQTFAIAGLLREDIESSVNKLPGVGELPVLGALFRSEEFQKSQTELVLLVTPHLVKPLPAGAHPLPTDHYIEPNDYEFYLLGRLEGRSGSPTLGRATSASNTNAAPQGVLGDHGYRLPVPAPR